MRLTYMVTPYHLLDVESRQLLPLTVETVTARGLGLWAEVCLQSSTAHKLQTTSLISVEDRPDGKRCARAPPGRSSGDGRGRIGDVVVSW